MMAEKQFDRFRRMHKLINAESTGTPKEFADKLHVSRSHLYNLLRELKERGAHIKYLPHRQTYCYTSEYELDFKY